MNTTIVIKVHERHQLLKNLLESIRIHWPDVVIIVPDDSRQDAQNRIKRACKKYSARHLSLEFDVGLSRGRNLAVDQVDTETFILMEEDFLIPEAGADLERLVNNLDENSADICGGDLIQLNRGGRRLRTNYAGVIESKRQDSGHVHIHHKPSTCDHGLEVVDIILNFFAARTDVIQRHRWDDDLKLCEHFEFFYRAKLSGIRVMMDHDVVIYHDHSRPRSPVYNRQRRRARHQFAPVAMGKHNITLWTDGTQRIRYNW